MQITDLTGQPTSDSHVRAYVKFVFDNCFAVGEIRVMQGPTGLFVSFPTKKQRDGSDRVCSAKCLPRCCLKFILA